MRNITKVKCTAAAPGAATGETTLLDTTTEWPANFFATVGVSKVAVDIAANGTGRFLAYKSANRGTAWQLIGATAVTGSTTTTTKAEWPVEAFSDFKLTWDNTGSTAQTTWLVDIALVPQRAALT